MEYWAEEVLPQYGVTLLNGDPKDFSCLVKARRTNGIGFGNAVLSSYSGAWKHNAWAHVDSLRFHHVLDGNLWVKVKGGVEFSVTQGETFVIGPENVAEFSIIATNLHTSSLVQNVAVVPLNRMEDFHRFIPRNLGLKLPETPACGVLSTFVGALCSCGTSNFEFVRLTDSFTELVAATLGASGLNISPQVQEDIYFRAVAFIRKNHRHASVTTEMIAKAVGVSERVLFDVFRRNETSPHKYLNRMRIETAKMMLTGRRDKATILDVALRSGFDSVSTFNRQFRSQTGIAPSDYEAHTDWEPTDTGSYSAHRDR